MAVQTKNFHLLNSEIGIKGKTKDLSFFFNSMCVHATLALIPG